MKASELIMLLDSIHTCDVVEDRRMWKLEDSGMFSCKYIFKELISGDDFLSFHMSSFGNWWHHKKSRFSAFSLERLNTLEIL